MGTNPLIVEEGSMTRLRAKRVKEAMGLLAQATMDEASIVTNKETSLMLGLEKKYEVEQFDSSNIQRSWAR